MPVLICSTTYGGCGFIGNATEFTGDDDFVFCPQCNKDAAFQLLKDNFESLSNDGNRELARKLVEGHRSVVGIAQCGCVHHAEDGIPCPHDVTLARNRFYGQTA